MGKQNYFQWKGQLDRHVENKKEPWPYFSLGTEINKKLITDLSISTKTIKLYKKTLAILSSLDYGRVFVRGHKKLEV